MQGKSLPFKKRQVKAKITPLFIESALTSTLILRNKKAAQSLTEGKKMFLYFRA